METDPLYLRDAYLASFEAVVTGVDGNRVSLDRTAFYPTGGGQPHDTGTLAFDGGQVAVSDVIREGPVIWHSLDGGEPHVVGTAVRGALDWPRRHALMRTHSALHVLCGVIWNGWGKAVTGGQMEPLRGASPPVHPSGNGMALGEGGAGGRAGAWARAGAPPDGRAVGRARMDFEFDPLPEGFGATVEALVNAELMADRPIEVSFLARGEALADAALIRTKVNLIPESVRQVRVVDIVGLDRQADGGTHVATTAEVGRVRVVKTESKGKGNKRIRLVIEDGPAAEDADGAATGTAEGTGG